MVLTGWMCTWHGGGHASLRRQGFGPKLSGLGRYSARMTRASWACWQESLRSEGCHWQCLQAVRDACQTPQGGLQDTYARITNQATPSGRLPRPQCGQQHPPVVAGLGVVWLDRQRLRILGGGSCQALVGLLRLLRPHQPGYVGQRHGPVVCPEARGGDGNVGQGVGCSAAAAVLYINGCAVQSACGRQPAGAHPDCDTSTASPPAGQTGGSGRWHKQRLEVLTEGCGVAPPRQAGRLHVDLCSLVQQGQLVRRLRRQLAGQLLHTGRGRRGM